MTDDSFLVSIMLIFLILLSIAISIGYLFLLFFFKQLAKVTGAKND